MLPSSFAMWRNWHVLPRAPQLGLAVALRLGVPDHRVGQLITWRAAPSASTSCATRPISSSRCWCRLDTPRPVFPAGEVGSTRPHVEQGILLHLQIPPPPTERSWCPAHGLRFRRAHRYVYVVELNIWRAMLQCNTGYHVISWYSSLHEMLSRLEALIWLQEGRSVLLPIHTGLKQNTNILKIENLKNLSTCRRNSKPHP